MLEVIAEIYTKWQKSLPIMQEKFQKALNIEKQQITDRTFQESG